jgi:hypothetical protein
VTYGNQREPNKNTERKKKTEEWKENKLKDGVNPHIYIYIYLYIYIFIVVGRDGGRNGEMEGLVPLLPPPLILHGVLAVGGLAPPAPPLDLSLVVGLQPT